MIATPHALVGALSAKTQPSTARAFTAGVASHFLLDRIRHTDYPIAGRSGKLAGVSDLAAAAALLRAGRVNGKRMLAGAVGGILPDVLTIMEGRGRRGPITRLHDLNHVKREPTRIGNVAIQTGLTASALWLLRDLNRPKLDLHGNRIR